MLGDLEYKIWEQTNFIIYNFVKNVTKLNKR